MWNSPPANIAADSSMRPLIYPGLDFRSLPGSILKACSTDSAYGPNVRVYRAALRTLLHGDYVDHTITFRECCLCNGSLRLGAETATEMLLSANHDTPTDSTIP